jgi:hypothetical protein
MNSKDIFINGLTDEGFSGVCNDGCGCSIQEFNLCGEFNINECNPGYKIKTNCGKCTAYQTFCHGESDTDSGYCIVESKELAVIMNSIEVENE